MTLPELARLHAETISELDAAQAIADESGSLEARKASNEVERLQQKLAKLNDQRRRFPSLGGHDPFCWCGGCMRIGGRVSAEPVKNYAVVVPESLHAKLKALGADRVRAALEELAQNA